MIIFCVILLLFAVQDFFGIYTQNTSNETVQIYKKKKEEERKKKNRKKKKEEKEEETKPEKSILDDYWIFDLKYLIIVIKKPIFFEYLCK